MDTDEASTCPLCRHEKVKIFAVGDCAHPICYICSTKMRILCEQTYCAICRQDLPKIYLVSNVAETQPPFDQSRFNPVDGTGDCGIYYPSKSDWIRRETEKLLRNFCPFCRHEYETFDVLRDHVRRSHHYFYCELCYDHLNLFPFERKCYSRQDLVQHTRYGDRDDKSFKGHPLCRFCDDHFLDVDQLYKHMRKEHYYCHLCENDNIYYSDFDLLRDHYRSNHYLCEIGQCKDVQFTNVFSSEMEFRAHQAAQHSKTRAEARQLGTIPVEFQSTRRQQHDPAHRGTFKSGEFKTQGNNNTMGRSEREETRQEPAVAVTVPSIDEFPTLNESSSTSQNAPQRGAWSNDVRGIHSADDFPALTAAGNAAVGQTRGIWREQPAIVSTSANQNTTSKKSAQSTNTITNGMSSMNVTEDFPALVGAANRKIPAPVSMFSTWSTAKKSAKQTNNSRVNQPQTRMNTNRLMYNDEDDEYIRRPMSSLMTSTAATAKSNITMVANTDTTSNQTKPKNQSLPGVHDFPALPSNSNAVQTNSAASGVWTAAPGSNSPNAQQKKKSAGKSKKKFLEEVNTMPPPPSLSSTNDFPTIGLSELGKRLIKDEDEPIKQEKPVVVVASTSVKQENKVPNQSNEKKQKSPKTKETPKPETATINKELPEKSVTNQVSSSTKSPIQNEPTSQTITSAAPPGFSAPSSVPPPPGFGAAATSESTKQSYIYHASYPKQKDEFRAKIFTLFDGDQNLFVEYDRFCEAFFEKTIESTDFIKFTRQLFKDKLDEYLLDLIVITPNIEQQNELYTIWEKDIHSLSNPTTTTTTNKSNANKNWTTKSSDETKVYKCRICQQIMFENDSEEHNSNHAEFNSQFPSLPNSALPIGRGSGRKKR